MRKLNILYLFIIGCLLFVSCDNDYDLEVDMSNTEEAFLLTTSDDVTVSETKSFDLDLKTYIPLWEDITVNWVISGDGFNSFSGSSVFPKMVGDTGDSSASIEIVIPASVVPDGELSIDGVLTYECTTQSGKIVNAGDNLGERGSIAVTINKYIPLDRSVFVGTYTENDGDGGVYTGVVVSEDPDNEFGLIISTKSWGSGAASYKVVFSTVAEIINCPSQFIGYDYWDGASTDELSSGALWFSNATDETLVSSFNTTTGSFQVPVNMALKYYPYDFGDYLMSYVKE